MGKMLCVDCGIILGDTLEESDYGGTCGLCSGFRAQKEYYSKRVEEERLKSLNDEEMLSTIENWWYVYKNEESDSPEDEAMHIKIMNRIIDLTGIKYDIGG